MLALRSFIGELDRHGLLHRVQKLVDWKYEIGKISREIKMPVMFENIKDYPNGKVFVNGLSSYPAIALALGMQYKVVRAKDIVGKIKTCFSRPIGPATVERNPAWDNQITRSIDFAVLPIPWWSETDVGRYIGTWHINISRDPENGIRNIGVYRMQLLAPNRTTVSISENSHLALQIKKAERRKEPIPMAVAIGVDERLIISAAAAPAYGIDEYALAGGLIGSPVELTRCKTQPLEVPIDSEVVIEGYIKPGTRVQDGPFLDYAGILNVNKCAYLFEATALSFRHDLIFRGTAVGRPGAEDHQLYSILAGAHMADFHGSRARHFLQTFFLRHRAFRLFQLSGRFGHLFNAKMIAQNTGEK